MKENRDFIVGGIHKFQQKHQLPWSDITVGIAGDLMKTLAGQKVLYSKPLPDYALFMPENMADAEKILAEFAALGCPVDRDEISSKPGVVLWIYVFSLKVPVTKGPFPAIKEPEGWHNPLVNRRKLESAALPGEMTPLVFKNEQYRLENVMAHFLTPGAESHSRPTSEYHFRIRRVANDTLISIPLMNHYFASGYVKDDFCYCFATNLGENGRSLSMIRSDDLISWEKIRRVLDLRQEQISICNTGVTFDGSRYVMLYECNDPAYPIFTFKFLASDDLINWEPIEGAIYGADKYVGGPALYWSCGWYYVTYVDLFIHPEVRQVCFRTSISRSKDLINWEDAPEERAVVMPDFNNRPDPEHFPEVYDVNASDAEFIEEDGKVKVFFIGGNQWGVSDNQVAEYNGTADQLFQEFFK